MNREHRSWIWIFCCLHLCLFASLCMLCRCYWRLPCLDAMQPFKFNKIYKRFCKEVMLSYNFPNVRLLLFRNFKWKLKLLLEFRFLQTLEDSLSVKLNSTGIYWCVINLSFSLDFNYCFVSNVTLFRFFFFLWTDSWS